MLLTFVFNKSKLFSIIARTSSLSEERGYILKILNWPFKHSKKKKKRDV